MTAYTAQDCRDVMDNGLSNILAVYAQASAQEITSGLNWYRTAYEEAVSISTRYDVPLLTVVQVACALSPRLQWEVNMQVAERVVRYYKSGGRVPDIQPYADGTAVLQRTAKWNGKPVVSDVDYLPKTQATKVNMVKALWILQGYTWVLRGAKVSSFMDNIFNHETSDAVTVDSHAIQVWRGIMEPGTYSIPAAFYDIIAAAYRKAAELLKITALQLQAITWLAKKRITAMLKKLGK